jgi:hypothetical protein
MQPSAARGKTVECVAERSFARPELRGPSSRTAARRLERTQEPIDPGLARQLGAPPALGSGKSRELWERIELANLSDCGELSRVLVHRPVHHLSAPDGLRKRDPHRRLRVR